MKELFGKIAGKLNKINNSSFLRKLINSKISEYGEVQKLNIESDKKTISIDFLAAGEDHPWDILISAYSFDDDDLSITLKAASSQRNWLNAVIQNYFIGQKIKFKKLNYRFIKGFLS